MSFTLLKLELEVLAFKEGGKPENPRRKKKKTLEQGENQQQSEPGPHWWEARALTTASSPCYPIQQPNNNNKNDWNFLDTYPILNIITELFSIVSVWTFSGEMKIASFKLVCTQSRKTDNNCAPLK